MVDGAFDEGMVSARCACRDVEGVLVCPCIFSPVVFLDDSWCWDASGAEVGVIVAGRPAAVEVERAAKVEVQ